MNYILKFEAEIHSGKPKYGKYFIKNGYNEIPLESPLINWDLFTSASDYTLSTLHIYKSANMKTKTKSKSKVKKKIKACKGIKSILSPVKFEIDFDKAAKSVVAELNKPHVLYELYRTRTGIWKFRKRFKNGQIPNHQYNSKQAAIRGAKDDWEITRSEEFKYKVVK